MTYGIDSRRINHLCTEVTKFGRFYITQFRNGISSWNDTRVSRHKSVYIGPDFQTCRIQSRSNNGSRIVRATTSEVRHISCRFIRRDESRHQWHFRDRLESLFHQLISQVSIQRVFTMFSFGLDKSARIEPFCSVNQFGNDDGWKAFTIADDCIRSLRGKVSNQINSLEDVLQLVQQFANLTLQRHLLFSGRNHLLNHLHMTVNDFAELALVCWISCCRHLWCIYQFVSDASQCGNNYNYRLTCRLYNSLYA